MPIVSSKEPSQRQLRVAQEIKKIIAAALERGEVRNPLILDNFITITDVDISPDLKLCTIYFMTLNGQNLGQIEDDLNAEAWGLKKQIASKLKLRYTPDLNFRMDTSFAEVDRIEKLLRDPKVAQDLEHKEEN
ncbi:MAG: 30S ribosome-binding factor RbfA [Alphaproteobacteria bacterium]|nr:30S ribosome-binding factor RbfA [Alphaproteobacteria bacterium]MBP3687807.1 30S ribosome-binding factor RbfA [Alphaproteobacteria bacterium]